MPERTNHEAYSVSQFCEIYGIGKTFLYAEIKGNRLKACKAGAKTLILREEAERWARSLPRLGISAPNTNSNC